MYKLVAMLITKAGIIVAVCAAAKLPDAGRSFPSTTSFSLAALAVAAAGMIVWRLVDRPVPVDPRSQPDDGRNPLRLVQELQGPLQQLCQDAPALESHALRRRLDELVDRYVLPFTEARRTVIHILGIQEGAELLIEFALGERLLNRAWSAAADGHLPEAIASLDEAQKAFSLLISGAGATGRDPTTREL